MRNAVVTGAAVGLGRAIAHKLAGEGYRLALVDVAETQLKGVARELPAADAVVLNITDEDAVEAAIARICAAFGAAPDVLVNNAGIVRFGNLLEHSAEDFRKVLDVNLVGTFIMTKAVGKRMAARGSGAIVNITSLNAIAPSPDAGSYPAAKAAVAKLTEQFALVLGPHGVRINSVAPGFIDAGMSAPIYADAAVRSVRGAAVPLGRIGRAEDVADAVAYLVSDKAAYIHAQHLMVDGGVFCSLKNHLPRKAPSERS